MNDNLKHFPGRLGNPTLTLLDDPRLDPRLKAALQMAPAQTAQPPAADASLEDCLAFCSAFEDASAAGHEMQWAMMPKLDSVARREEIIAGDDGNEIRLYIHAPAQQSGPVPCIVHTHGGGMVLMTAADPVFVRWRDALADAGLVVVGVEFRNGGGKLGNHPFPAGLNDCAAATRWVHANRAALNISGIVISGESGGGNLCIATTLKAKAEGWLDAIDGVYAFCPYISGAYAQPPAELLSLQENDGYTLSCATMVPLVRVYDPDGVYSDDPLAWPLAASEEMLAGLPAHVISVNELDPLRDEGLAFYRKLMAAGVSVAARTALGTPHAGDLMMPDVVPEVFAESLGSVCAFARRVAS